MEILMNYKYTTLYALLFTFFGCNGMHLDFTHMHHETGVAKGEKAAKAVLGLSKESSDILRPLTRQFYITMGLLKEHPEAKDEFSGFALGYAVKIFRYNQQHPEAPIKLRDTVVQNLSKSSTNTITDIQAQKNREELVKLLTAQLIDKNLLILDL